MVPGPSDIIRKKYSKRFGSFKELEYLCTDKSLLPCRKNNQISSNIWCASSVHSPVSSTQSIEDAVEDITIICNRHGGALSL